MKHPSPLFKSLVLAMLSLAASAASAQSKEPMDIPESDSGKLSIGLKFWNANWDTNRSAFYPPTARIRGSDSTNGITVTPTIQYKYKDFAVSASTLLLKDFSTATDYVSVSDNKGMTNNSEYSKNRKEYDINFSYFLKQNISASIGYKNISFVDSGGSSFTVDGPIIGLSASAYLTEKTSLYTNIGLGKMKVKGISEAYSTYGLIETGIAYSLHEWIKDSAITFSYRQQEIKASNLWGADFEYVDTTRGVAIGFTKSF